MNENKESKKIFKILAGAAVIVGSFLAISFIAYGLYAILSPVSTTVEDNISYYAEDVDNEEISESASIETEKEASSNDYSLKDLDEGVNTPEGTKEISDEVEVVDTTDEDVDLLVNDDGEEVDEMGNLRSESTYLDDDGDSVPNAMDVCEGIDDYSDECN